MRYRSCRLYGLSLSVAYVFIVQTAPGPAGVPAFAAADVSIRNTDSPDPVNTSAALTYTILVKNTGADAASSIRVADTLPSGVSFLGAAGDGWSCSIASGTVTCLRQRLDVGESPPIVVTVISPALAGSLSNRASVSALESDPNPADNSDTDVTTDRVGIENADLSIDNTDSPDPVLVGSELIYTLIVTNVGPDPAGSVQVHDTLPPGVSFVDAVGVDWSCSHTVGTVLCTRDSLDVGPATPITITATSPARRGAVINTAAVSSATSDPVTSNNTEAEETTTALTLEQADLSITVADGPDPANAGSTLTYTLDVSNLGPGAAGSIRVTDTLPQGVVFLDASGDGWSCKNASGKVTCERESLAAGAAPPIKIALITPSGSGDILNEANVTFSANDPAHGNDSDNETTSIAESTLQSDLSIAQTDDIDPVNAGSSLTYTLNATNAGPERAGSVTVIDTLPAAATFLLAAFEGWSCVHVAGTLTCSMESLEVGPAPPITITVTAPAVNGTFVNRAAVCSALTDPQRNDNTQRETTKVVGGIHQADLSIEKTDGADPVTAGASIQYTLQVGNLGPDPASSVLVTDVLPAGTSFIGVSGTNWSCGLESGLVNCSRIGLDVGPAPPIVVSVAAPAGGGLILNAATAVASEIDFDADNNTDTEETTVEGTTVMADLSIQKTDEPDPVVAGSQLAYVLDVVNAGPETASVVRVTDRLPETASFVNVTGDGWSCGHESGIITCTQETFGIGASSPISILVTAPAEPGTVTNRADVTAAEDDPDMAGNIAEAVTNVVRPVRDLAILSLDAPHNVVLAGKKAARTGHVKLQIGNEGPEDEVIHDAASLRRLVEVQVESLGPCPAPIPVLRTGQTQGELPIVLLPGGIANVFFDVTFDCANDSARSGRGGAHDDFRFVATLHPESFDGQLDADRENDICPRSGPSTPSDDVPGHTGSCEESVLTDVVIP